MFNNEDTMYIVYNSVPGRGMNAAFAIGRLCDMDQGRKRLLQLNDSERMVCIEDLLANKSVKT